MTPDWLWCCAERWEHVDERLYPLNVDTAAVRRKPPAHCTSPDVALQLAMAAGVKEEQTADVAIPVYDRVTGKRVFRRTGPKNSEKGKALASRSAVSVRRLSVFYLKLDEIHLLFDKLTQSERMQRRFSETFNPLLSFSSEDIADMDREVEDILHEFDATDDDDDDEEEEIEPKQRQKGNFFGNF